MERTYITYRHVTLSDNNGILVDLKRTMDGVWFIGYIDKRETNWIKSVMYSHSRNSVYQINIQFSGVSPKAIVVRYNGSVAKITYEKKYIDDILPLYFKGKVKPDVRTGYENDHDVYIATVNGKMVAKSMLVDEMVQMYKTVNMLHLAVYEDIESKIWCYIYKNQFFSIKGITYKCDIRICVISKTIDIMNPIKIGSCIYTEYPIVNRQEVKLIDNYKLQII